MKLWPFVRVCLAIVLMEYLSTLIRTVGTS